ncbi:hypothetical protein [Streptomyces sp. PT19]
MENLPLHELGLLRGAVEGHDTHNFGSLWRSTIMQSWWFEPV